MVALLCLFWGTRRWNGSATSSEFTLCVVMLCFLRGFTYFRSFQMTRVFVHLTIEVVKEVYSFLVILAYSVLSFGIFAAVIREGEAGSLAEAWTSAFNLVMGSFDSSQFNSTQWTIFMSAGIVNVVIMMNLLISILAEAYNRTQLSMLESDQLQQLSFLLECEHCLFWRRKAGAPTVLATCKSARDMRLSEIRMGRTSRVECLAEKERLGEKAAFVKGGGENYGRVEEELGVSVERLKETQEKVSQSAASIEEMTLRTEATSNRIMEQLAQATGKIAHTESAVSLINQHLSTVEIAFNERLAHVEEKLEAILASLQLRSQD